MPYELTTKPAFIADLIQLPRNEQKKVARALERLTEDPFAGKTKRIFGHSYRNLYRYRTDAYRVVFAAGSNTVALLAVGKRDNVYERFRPEDVSEVDAAESVAPELVQLPTVPDDPPLAEAPEGNDSGDAEETEAASPSSAGSTQTLLKQLLELWDIPADSHEMILGCESAEALMDAGLPDHVLEAVLHVTHPPDATATIEQPTLAISSPSELESISGPHALTDFLLRLDPEQQPAADRHAKGPAMVKGGAGTGKSIVALYRIRNLFRGAAQGELFGGDSPRVLFLTYTKALTNASAQLLDRLLGAEDRKHVEVRTLDSLAASLAGGGGARAGRDEQLAALQTARARVAFSGGPLEIAAAKRALERLSDSYLLEEFDWVIDGQAAASADEYLAASRRGRGTALNRSARGAAWKLYEAWRAQLRGRGQSTHTQIEGAALTKAAELGSEKKYDAVVVDEAQDLRPVGLRLALAVCRDPEGFYMTADDRQSIYGRGFSWSAISEDLKLRGRTTTLRRNYRSTRQIAQGAHAFLKAHGLDAQAADSQAVREGPRPVCLGCIASDTAALAPLLKGWATELRVPLWAGAVLTRGRSSGQRVAEALAEQGIPAKWVESKDLNLEAKHLKVMTIHAAKGLEFPFVAVANVAERGFPSTARKNQDEDDRVEWLAQERRLFHVALTRAMRRLAVCYPDDRPSEFVTDLDRQLWDWRTV